MRKSKLYLVLKEFDKYEQNRCRKYIQSPYFNRSEKLCDLYEILIDCINTSEAAPKAEEILKKLHPGEVIKDSRWRKYCSDLYKLVEDYLAQEEYSKDNTAQVAYLIDAVAKKNIGTVSKNAIKRTNKVLEFSDKFPNETYYDKYYLELKKYDLQKANRRRESKSNIEEIILSLDNFYISKKLKYYCDILSRKSTVAHNYNVKFIDELLNYLSKLSEKDLEPVILIYYRLVLMINDLENVGNYYEIKKLLKKYAVQFPQEEAYTMYSFVVNYCARKINSGEQTFFREYFEIYKQLLTSKIIIINGELDVGIFKNLVAVGTRLKEYEWTKNFIDEYQNYLPDKQRENAVSLNSALFYFHLKNYDTVIELLRTVEYEDFLYNLNAKQLLLKTYYEIKEEETLFFFFESFRAYVRRNNSISSDKKSQYLNLIKHTKKLSSLFGEDKKTLQKIKEDVQNEKYLSNRSWLLEKIAELE